MLGPAGFTVKHYSLSGVEGSSQVHETGVVVFTVSENGTIDTWSTGDPTKEPPDPADGGIPVNTGDKVVITPSGGSYSIQVVPQ